MPFLFLFFIPPSWSLPSTSVPARVYSSPSASIPTVPSLFGTIPSTSTSSFRSPFFSHQQRSSDVSQPAPLVPTKGSTWTCLSSFFVPSSSHVSFPLTCFESTSQHVESTCCSRPRVKLESSSSMFLSNEDVLHMLLRPRLLRSASIPRSSTVPQLHPPRRPCFLLLKQPHLVSSHLFHPRTCIFFHGSCFFDTTTIPNQTTLQSLQPSEGHDPDANAFPPNERPCCET